MKAVKTWSSDSVFNFRMKENEKGFEMTIEIDYQTDRIQPQKVKTQGEFSVVFSNKGMKFNIAGEAVSIGNTSYIKLTTIPALPFLEPFLGFLGIDIYQLKNQWIKIDLESLRKWQEGILKEGRGPGMEEELKKQSGKQTEITQKIKELLENKKIYLVQKELPDETIEKTKVYHYQVALNREEIIKLIPELLELLKESTRGTHITLEEIEEMEEFFEKAGDFIAEVWIGKKDRLLYKLDFEKEIDLSKFEKVEKRKVLIKTTVSFSEFDEPLQIKPPTDFKPLEEFLELFMGGYLRSMFV